MRHFHVDRVISYEHTERTRERDALLFQNGGKPCNQFGYIGIPFEDGRSIFACGKRNLRTQRGNFDRARLMYIDRNVAEVEFDPQRAEQLAAVYDDAERFILFAHVQKRAEIECKQLFEHGKQVGIRVERRYFVCK